MFPFHLFAATGDVVARLDSVDGASVQQPDAASSELGECYAGAWVPDSLAGRRFLPTQAYRVELPPHFS
jgi:hypothetical protein